MQALRIRGDVNLVFIIPEDDFDSYRAQHILDAEGKPFTPNIGLGRKTDLENLVLRVQQWALKMPFKPIKMSARASCCLKRRWAVHPACKALLA